MHTNRVILLVEDSEDDAFLFQHAARSAGIGDSVRVVTNGEAALSYLSGQGDFQDRSRNPYPSLMLLDLNIPMINGFDVLKAVRSSPSLKTLPVVVLTSSREDRDVERAISLGANAYVCKRSGLDEQVQFAQAVRDFWLTFNEAG